MVETTRTAMTSINHELPPTLSPDTNGNRASKDMIGGASNPRWILDRILCPELGGARSAMVKVPTKHTNPMRKSVGTEMG